MGSRRTLRNVHWLALRGIATLFVLLLFLWGLSTALAVNGPCEEKIPASTTGAITCAPGGTGSGGCQGQIIQVLQQKECKDINEIACTQSANAPSRIIRNPKSTDRGTSVWLKCIAQSQKPCYACIANLGLAALLPPSSADAAAVVSQACGSQCQVRNLNVCCYTSCGYDATTIVYENTGTTCTGG